MEVVTPAKMNQSWHCLVRYKEGQKKEEVLVSTIKQKKLGQAKKVQFDPKHENDFDASSYYYVKTALDSDDGEPHRHPALILYMAETLIELKEKAKKRAKVPANIVSAGEDDGDTTEFEDADKQQISNVDIRLAQQAVREKLLHKKDASDIQSAHVLSEIQEASTSTEADLIKKLQADLAQRDKKLKKQEEELRKAKHQLSVAVNKNVLSQAVANCLQEHLNSTKKLLEDNIRSVDDKLTSFKTDVLNDLSKCPRYSNYVTEWVNMLPKWYS